MAEMNHRPTAGGSFAVSGARVFDGENVLVGHAVLVADGVVSGVLPCESIPEGSTRRHEPDCTIIPGLIDTHVHFMRWQGPQFLAFGVTTVRDTGNDLEWILDRRREWKNKGWPRILCLGPLLDGPAPGHEVVSRRCCDCADAVTAVAETAAKGVDGIKLYEGLNPQWLAAMVQKAHAAGCKVSMHCAGGGVIVTARAGVDEFYHLDGILADVWPGHPAGWLDVWGMPEFARTLDRQRAVADGIGESGITATPTLAYWDSQWRIRAAGLIEPEDLRCIPPSMVQWQSVPSDAASSQRWRRALRAAQDFVGLLLDRGVPVLAGSDVPFGLVRPGLSLWNELALLVDAGMSPKQALRAATSDAAAFLGRPELGRLSPGAAADMVLVRGNPLERIPSRPDIVRVIVGGVSRQPQDLLPPRGGAGSILEDEPWAVQFERHWAKRR